MPQILHLDTGERVSLASLKRLALGGEAEVYELPGERALKVYLDPTHPSLAGDATLQQRAQERLEHQQDKLRTFPLAGLPSTVIQPQTLARNLKTKRILGYAMPLVRGAEPLIQYTDALFRARGAGPEQVTAIFQRLHPLLMAIHAAGVVIGDFTDTNVLVRGTEPLIIDADSFQFGNFTSLQFTTRFVDPLLCDAGAPAPQLVRRYTPEADWYAFAVMLFACLLLVHPFGGVYRSTPYVPPDARPLQRISVFHDGVKYPKQAFPLAILPEELRNQFRAMFEGSQRGVFPRALLDLHWTTCPQCALVHARTTCPICTPTVVKPPVQVNGAATLRLLHETLGLVLAATTAGGALRWIVAEGGQLTREDGTVVGTGPLDPQLRLHIAGATTVVGKGALVAVLQPGAAPRRIVVDTFTAAGRGAEPVFAATATHILWATGGTLWRDTPAGLPAAERVGGVVPDQTLIWAGERLGFGCYRLEAKFVGFVFDPATGTLNDGVDLPRHPGVLLDLTCAIGSDRAWFFAALEEDGQIWHHATVVRRDGSVAGTARARRGDGTWLGTLHSACASRHTLLAPTETGIIRLEAEGGTIREVARYPVPEVVLGPQVQLLAAGSDVIVMGPHALHLLTLT